MAQDTIVAPPGMKLVWNDEFDKGTVPDPEKWNFELGFVRNREPQWYQKENAYIQDGRLILEVRREEKENPNYVEGSTDWKTNRRTAPFTSASVTTKQKFSWLYGRFEMRAKIDTSPGIWPAFWTVGTVGRWPHNGEIDIMEFYAQGLLANVAWGTGKPGGSKWNTKTKRLKYFTDKDPDWSNKFHLWAMDWDENKIVLSVDGEVLNTQDLSQTINGDAEARNPFHGSQSIIINAAVGHGDTTNTKFPSRYEIDYVRVYQKQ